MCAPAGPTPPAATSDNAMRGRRGPCYRGPGGHHPTSTRGEDGRVTERDGTPVPGLTVPDVTRQLTWRVLGPLKGRAKSVLEWAGLRGEPPKTFQDAGRTYFVTGGTVAHRVQRVAAEGARLPLNDELIAELTRPTAPDEDPIMRQRCAHLLGIDPP